MIKLKDLILETWNSNIWPSDIWNSHLWNSDTWNSNIWENEEEDHDIIPTDIDKRLGRCYELSGRYVIRHHGWTLVHGTLINPFIMGHPKLPHAWCEKGNEILDPVMNKIWPKDVYEGLFKAKIHKKFTQKEVLQLTDKHGNWGPWESYK